MKKSIVLALALSLTATAFAAEFIDRMRGNVAIPDETTPPPLQNSDNSDIRRTRAYAQQPPVIPHKIDNYQIDRNANRCLLCHSRTRTQESQAPMISVSHYTDRNGNTLADISPRRFFCTQCHVPQVPLNPLVDNNFVDVEKMLQRGGAPAK